MENLLGETEKLIWTQWRMRYSDEYTNLVAIGDGNEGTQNIISQMRTVFTLEDPYQGSTLMQEEAYEIQGVTEFLTSRGVKAIPGEQVPTDVLRGRNWIIRPPVRRLHPQQPTTAVSRNLSNRPRDCGITNIAPV